MLGVVWAFIPYLGLLEKGFEPFQGVLGVIQGRFRADYKNYMGVPANWWSFKRNLLGCSGELVSRASWGLLWLAMACYVCVWGILAGLTKSTGHPNGMSPGRERIKMIRIITIAAIETTINDKQRYSDTLFKTITTYKR